MESRQAFLALPSLVLLGSLCMCQGASCSTANLPAFSPQPRGVLSPGFGHQCLGLGLTQRRSLLCKGPTHGAAQRRYHAGAKFAVKSSAADQWKIIQRWTRQEGIEFNKFEVKQLPAGYRGAVAKEDIGLGQLLCSVPAKSALAVSRDRAPDIPETFLRNGYWQVKDMSDPARPSRNWALKLSALLLYHIHLGESSNFHDFIRVLPRDVFSLPLLDSSLLAEVQDRELVTFVEEEKRWLLSSYEQVREYLAKDVSISFEDFCWALELVRSRVFSIAEEKYVLCPIADMVNHNSASHFPLFRYFSDEGAFQLWSDDVFGAGQEITFRYGELNNFQLLTFYGFCEDENPEEHVKVPLEVVRDRLMAWSIARTAADTRLLRLRGDTAALVLEGLRQDQGIEDYKGREMIRAHRGRVDRSLQALLRAWALTAQDVDKSSSQLAQMILQGSMLSHDNEREAVRALAHLGSSLTRDYPTSLEEDYRLYASAQSWPLKQCIKYRSIRKEIIKALSASSKEAYVSMGFRISSLPDGLPGEEAHVPLAGLH